MSLNGQLALVTGASRGIGAATAMALAGAGAHVVLVARDGKSLEGVEEAIHAAGGSAIQETGRLDRCFRDARVAAQHIGLSTNAYEIAGQVLLGLDPGTPRF